MKIGQSAVVIGCTNDHPFVIGQIVECMHQEEGEYYFFCEEDDSYRIVPESDYTAIPIPDIDWSMISNAYNKVFIDNRIKLHIFNFFKNQINEQLGI